MKSFTLVAVLLCLAAAVVYSDDMRERYAYSGTFPAVPAPSAGIGGGASMPALPCPKNYLFSCQPSLQPAPCSQYAVGGHGGTGAYSENYPIYALQVPQYVNGFHTY